MYVLFSLSIESFVYFTFNCCLNFTIANHFFRKVKKNRYCRYGSRLDNALLRCWEILIHFRFRRSDVEARSPRERHPKCRPENWLVNCRFLTSQPLQMFIQDTRNMLHKFIQPSLTGHSSMRQNCVMKTAKPSTDFQSNFQSVRAIFGEISVLMTRNSY